jgi:Glycosyltransferase family 87
MPARASTLSEPVLARPGSARLLVRAAYVALLAALPLPPGIGVSYWTYPGVRHPWALAVPAALFLLPLLDRARTTRIVRLDALALASFALAVALAGEARTWPLLIGYAPLAYLAVRMLRIATSAAAPPGTASADTDSPSRLGPAAAAAARGGASAGYAAAPSAGAGPAGRSRARTPTLSSSWLIAGIVALAAVHVSYALAARASTDVGLASIRGAERIVHGQALYAPDRALTAKLGYDPHFDTYGPATYEAYIPFTLFGGEGTASRAAALFFELLTAVLLFVLGRRARGPALGVLLAYAWLALPLGFYADELGTNDALVAATLTATLLVAATPVRRGAALALAAWTKLSPLVLLPLCAAHAAGERRRAGVLSFAAGFALLTVLLFAPVLGHSSVGAFVSRTFGFQLGRSPAYSLWAQFEAGGALAGASFAHALGAVLHGLCAALGVTLLGILLVRRTAHGTSGLAAACAAVLIALVFCDGYLALTYVLWFAPLVLFAVLAPAMQRPRRAPPGLCRSPSGAC